MGVKAGELQRTKAQVKDLTEKVWALRLKGRTYHEIGAELGISHTYAANLTKSRFAECPVEEINHARQVELERLDKMTARLWDDIEKSKKSPIVHFETVLKIADRRAKYLGLDAPSKLTLQRQIDVDSLASWSDEELLGLQKAMDKLTLKEAAGMPEGQDGVD